MKPTLFAFLMILSLAVTSAQAQPFSATNVIDDSFGEPFELVSTDMDRDGDQDILTHSADTPVLQVLWFENTSGDGSTWTKHIIDNNFESSNASYADLDRDGDPDVFAASDVDGLVWWENTAGNATVWVRHTISASELGSRVYPADIDGDGDPDILKSSTPSSDTAWFENVSGDGSVWTKRTIVGSSPTRDAKAADLDSDGDLDVVTVDFANDDVTWWENTAGTGLAWTRHVIDPAFTNDPYGLFPADLDGDGDVDVMGCEYTGQIAWWENEVGDGSAWTKHIIATGFTGPTNVYARDIDSDGDLDVMSAASILSDIAWWENTAGDGTAWTIHVLETDFPAADCAYADDMDNDGDIDIIGSAFTDGIAWWENLSVDNGAFGVFCSYNTINLGLSGVVNLAVGDLDGDSDMDALATDPDNDSLVWWESTLMGAVWVDHLIDGDYDGASSSHAADLDRDGDLDVLSTAAEADELTWWENTAGDASAWTEHTLDGAFDGASSVHAADLDRDGDLDIVAAAELADEVVWWENTAGDASAWTEHSVSTSFDGAIAVFSADVDGDGDSDIVGAARNDEVTWWENVTGNATFWSEHTVSATILHASSVYAADLDRDGDMDILAGVPSEDKITWWENTNGDGSGWFERPVDWDFSDINNVAASDMDKDGDLDVLGTAFGSNDLFWWENTISDGVAPVFSYTPNNLTVSCAADTSVASTNGPATATDACGVLISYSDAITPGSCPHNFTVTRTWTANDYGFNSVAHVQTITVDDQIAPVITTCPADLDSIVATIPDLTNRAAATDNCVTPDITQEPAPGTAITQPGSITMRMIASDGCDQADSCTFVLNPLFDFGDAPDPGYATLTASNGAWHYISSGLRLGTAPDGELDGQPNGDATGDMTDEDGLLDLTQLVLYERLTPAIDVNVINTVGPATLIGWIDYNGDGVWESLAEEASVAVNSSGVYTLTFPAVPVGSATASGGASFARFRISTDTGLAPTGLASDGEVEDYPVTLDESEPVNYLAGNDDSANWPTQAVPEDGVLTFNATNGNALTITDPAIGDSQIQTKLEATDGILHAANLNGVNYYYGQNSPTLTVRAPVAVLNNVLDGLTYTPTANFNGAATITWTTDDRGNTGGPAQIDTDIINITVAPVNDPPTAQTTTLTTPEDQMVSVDLWPLVADLETADASLTLTVSTPTNGTVALNADGHTAEFTPTADFFGTANFQYSVTDDGDGTAGPETTGPSTVTVNVTSVNDPPSQTTNAGLTVDEGNSGTIDDTVLRADDPDHSHAQLTYTVTTAPVNGTLSSTDFTQADLDGGSLSYQHDGSETTGDSFDFQVCDALNECISGTFNITITPVNDPPVADDDSYSTSEDTPLNITAPGVLANDTDVDGGALSAVLDSGPSNAASFILNADGSFNYTPASNWSGTDNFTYHANDTADDSNIATVTITVAGENDGPEITVPGAQTVDEDTDLDITGISVSDTDADPADIQLSASVANGTLTLLSPAGLTIVDPDGDASFVVQGTVAELNAALAAGLRYHGDPDYNGPDQIDLEVDDLGQSTRNRATITASIAITVNPVNDPPTLTVPGPFVVEAGQMIGVPGIVVSDMDAGSSNLQVDLAVTNGLLSTDGSTWAASLTLTDTELNLNTELANLQYQATGCNPTTDQITVDVDDLGNTGSGGNSTASGSIDGTIIDTTPPTLVCQAVTVDLVDGNPAIVTGDDIFDATNSTDNCGIDLYSLEIFLLTQGACSNNSGGTLLEFGCVDVGLTVDVELIGMDNAGNPDTCQTTVTVTTSDPSLCEPCTGSGTTVTLNLPGRRAVAISPPVNLASPTVGDVFASLPANKLVYTRNCNGTYRYLTDADELESGVGYFVRTGFYTTVDVDFIGCELTAPVQIERCGTWNGFMTGNPFPYALDVSNIQVSPPAPIYMQVFVNGYWRTGINPVPVGAAVQIYTSATCLTINPDPAAALLSYASDATPDQPGEDPGGDTVAQTSSRDWEYRLEQSTPNPFTHTATIRYQLPVGQRVKLDVFNVAGQLIRTLVDSDVAAGDHEITWDGTSANGESVNSGVYFYRLTTNDFSETKRMVLMR